MDSSGSSSSDFFSDPKTITKIVYALFAAGFITSGFFWPMTLVAVLIMYNKKNEVANTIYECHFEWLLHTFWWSLFLLTINFILTFIYIGYFGIIATIVWVMYRLVNGFICLLSGISPLKS